MEKNGNEFKALLTVILKKDHRKGDFRYALDLPNLR